MRKDGTHRRAQLGAKDAEPSKSNPLVPANQTISMAFDSLLSREAAQRSARRLGQRGRRRLRSGVAASVGAARAAGNSAFMATTNLRYSFAVGVVLIRGLGFFLGRPARVTDRLRLS